ncbi:hypothetical protein EKO04_002070 [Ascochyta lentis]|uniref:Uncharacterized protein n=1 Tax=Ascochyta lentis TaxID=205686 RepID=A0A8H7JDC6_9PLEO|nr:hypothetical protein EKO04_002070 [Ascochyta lentis]
MASSQRNARKRSTWSIVFYFLVLFVGIMLVKGARAENQQSLTIHGDDARELVLGIQLGSSYSRVGIMRSGKFEMITDDQGGRVMPSWAAFAGGERLVGEAVDTQSASNPHRSVFDIRHFIGRQPSDSFKVEEAEHVLTLEANSAIILSKLKENADRYLSQPVENAVIAVPAYYNDAQRASIKNAGSIAGLDVLRVINEPTAAALAYGLDGTDKPEFQIVPFGYADYGQERNVLVYDLGASTLDVSIVTIEEGVFEIRSTAGDKQLGGNDFNNLLIKHLAEKYNKDNNVDDAQDTRTMDTLSLVVEKAKLLLSFRGSTLIETRSFSETLTRAHFEVLNDDLFNKTLEPIKQALENAKMKRTDIDDVVLSGGSTHIPKVQQMLEEYFDGKKVHKSINPEEVVAMGAAVQGSFLANSHAHEGCTLSFNDVVKLSLVVESTDGCTIPVVKRGANLPTRKIQTLSTTSNNQSTFSIKVFEGERPKTENNHKLAEFHLAIPPAPRGIAQIEVTLELDLNNNIKVSALDLDSRKSESIIILNSGRVSDEKYVLGALEQAEEWEDEDRVVRASCQSRRRLEDYVYDLKRQIRDFKGPGGRIGEDREMLISAVEETEHWLDEMAASAGAEDFDAQTQKLFDVVDSVVVDAESPRWWQWSIWWCW